MNETNPIRSSFAIASPISPLPLHNDATAPGIPFFSNTFATIFVVAIDIRLVLEAPFHTTLFPHT